MSPIFLHTSLFFHFFGWTKSTFCSASFLLVVGSSLAEFWSYNFTARSGRFGASSSFEPCLMAITSFDTLRNQEKTWRIIRLCTVGMHISVDHPCHVALEDDAKRCTESTLRFIPSRVWHCLDSRRCSGSEHAAVNAARYSFQGFLVVDLLLWVIAWYRQFMVRMTSRN